MGSTSKQLTLAVNLACCLGCCAGDDFVLKHGDSKDFSLFREPSKRVEQLPVRKRRMWLAMGLFAALIAIQVGYESGTHYTLIACSWPWGCLQPSLQSRWDMSLGLITLQVRGGPGTQDGLDILKVPCYLKHQRLPMHTFSMAHVALTQHLQT